MIVDSSATDSSFDGLCTITLQGGGVLGFSLVGQLEAIDDMPQLRPLAYAGASAGALVACLRWAGVKAADIGAIFQEEVKRDGGIEALLGPAASETSRWSASLPRVQKIFDKVRKAILNGGPALNADKSGKGRLGQFVGDSIGSVGTAAWGVANWRLLRRSFRNGGFFAGGGVADLLDRHLRDRLRAEIETAKAACAARDEDEDGPEVAAWLKAIGLPDPSTPAFEQHRPRFIDFDVVRYRLGGNHADAAALLLSITNAETGRPVFVDSYNAAFEHLVISDAVRASIGFPMAFQPQPITYVKKTGDKASPATRETLIRTKAASSHDTHKTLDLESNAFIDGGMSANFPIWAVARYMRQTLYGHTPGLDAETVRLDRPNDPADAERFTSNGSKLDHHLPTGTPHAKDTRIDSPARALAFRPTLHIGLNIIEDRAAQGGPLSRILDSALSGARKFHEDLALADHQRLLLIDQRLSETGWPDAFILDFRELKAEGLPKLMREKGKKAATEKLKELPEDLAWPSPHGDPGKPERSIDSVLSDAAKSTLELLKYAVTAKGDGAQTAAPKAVIARLLLVKGAELHQFHHHAEGVSRPPRREPVSLVCDDEYDTPEHYAYFGRAIVLSRGDAPTWTRSDKVGRPALRLCFPVVDTAVKLPGALPLLRTMKGSASHPRKVRQISPNQFTIVDEQDAVLFGLMTVEVFAEDPVFTAPEDNSSDRHISPAALELAEAIIGGDRRHPVLVDAMLRSLQVEAQQLSAMLSAAFPGAQERTKRTSQENDDFRYHTRLEEKVLSGFFTPRAQSSAEREPPKGAKTAE